MLAATTVNGALRVKSVSFYSRHDRNSLKALVSERSILDRLTQIHKIIRQSVYFSIEICMHLHFRRPSDIRISEL